MDKLNSRLLLLATCLLILSAAVLSYLSLRHFEQELAPEMSKKAIVVGESVASLFDTILGYGIPFNEMVGVEKYLDSIRKDTPAILYISISDPNGNILYQSGLKSLRDVGRLNAVFKTPIGSTKTERIANYLNTALPILRGNQSIGAIHLGQDALIIQQKLEEILYDIITVLVVAGLIAFELMRFVVTFTVAAPITLIKDILGRVKQGHFNYYMPADYFGGIGRLNVKFNAATETINQTYQNLMEKFESAKKRRGADFTEARVGVPIAALGHTLTFDADRKRPSLSATVLDYIRWPFFLLIFSDSLSLSFFPLYVEQFYSPGIGISKQLVIGLPISVFMFIWALSMPWAGLWSDRVGYRKAFIYGAFITTIGLILTGLAQTLYDLLLWRSITAVGYGMVFVTAQSYITNHTPPEHRTKGMAVFLASFFAGSLSGAAIGGILADRIGYSITFLISAFLSLGAGLFVLRFLHDTQRYSSVTAGMPAKKNLSWSDLKLLLQNRRFVTVTFLAAIPSKIALTGFLYYSAPLYLKFLGNSPSVTGRVMMAYGLAIIILSPMIARLADMIGRHRLFVSTGGFAAAMAMFITRYSDSTFGVLIGITFLGVAHSIGVSPQLALMSDSCQDVIKEVGVGTLTGIFRLIERLGNVFGPLIAGLFIASYGFKGAFYGIGLISLISAILFTVLLFIYERMEMTPKTLPAAG